MFNDVYKGKRVLVTGHTGFKGSWLICWLLKMGAHVIGASKDIPTTPSMFNDLKLKELITHHILDIRDLELLKKLVIEEKPDIIFHLAAQPIVSVSYEDPIETITSNAFGTMNIMETLRKVDWPCITILITSDKSYDNIEQVWGYKETDNVGGKDIYSGSKGAAELIIKSYFNSFFHEKNPYVKIAIGRAGNVIGGGDWAKDRIVVDAVKAWSINSPVEIRCPDATRPWQHVLEPLSGYLALAQNLLSNQSLNGEAFNFGPRAEQNKTVTDLLTSMAGSWTSEVVKKPFNITDNIPFEEAGLLKLNCDKALYHLNWEASLDYTKTVEMTSQWYSSYYNDEVDLFQFTNKQIEQYYEQGLLRKLIWTK